MSLWRALMQGVGWRVGREMAEDLIASVKSDIDAPETPRATPEETPAERAKRLRVAAERAAAEAEAARKAKAAQVERDRKDVDRELEALKKKLGR